MRLLHDASNVAKIFPLKFILKTKRSWNKAHQNYTFATGNICIVRGLLRKKLQMGRYGKWLFIWVCVKSFACDTVMFVGYWIENYTRSTHIKIQIHQEYSIQSLKTKFYYFVTHDLMFHISKKIKRNASFHGTYYNLESKIYLICFM